ncbi:MAG: hypothetical protein Q7S61_04505 [bacterium]|nr:hypothetical protein [bacterium]
MPKVEELPRAKKQIKKLRLQEKYDKQKSFFITNPSHPSLDFCMWDHKQRLSSFKVDKQYRAMVVKKGDNYTIISVKDFHRKQPKK